MTALHIARPEDIETILPMVASYHAFEGIEMSEDARRETVVELLRGTVPGVAYIIGPRRSPVGYIALSFGFSIELGGMDAMIDEFFIRQAVRGRGMGSEVLMGLLPALNAHGIKAIHLEVDRDNDRARALYARAGFKPRDKYSLMTRISG